MLKFTFKWSHLKLLPLSVLRGSEIYPVTSKGLFGVKFVVSETALEDLVHERDSDHPNNQYESYQESLQWEIAHEMLS